MDREDPSARDQARDDITDWLSGAGAGAVVVAVALVLIGAGVVIAMFL